MSARIPVRFPDYIRGFRSRVINGILDYLCALEPEDSADIKWTRTPSGFSGRVMHGWGNGGSHPALFDLIQTASNKVKLRGRKHDDGTTIAMPAGFGVTSFIASAKFAQIAGVDTAIVEDAGGGSMDFDTELTITATDLLYVYIESDLTANPPTRVAYLERYTAASGRHIYQDGGDESDFSKSYVYYGLWLIEYTSPAITYITNFQTGVRLDAAAN